jgi:hypothetical protein
MMLEQFQKARQCGVPITVLRTADQQASFAAILSASPDYPVLRWDAVGGVVGANPSGVAAARRAACAPEDTVRFTEAMVAAGRLPEGCVLFAFNAHRQLTSVDPGATASAVQAVSSLRDDYKRNFRMVVLGAPDIVLPPELEHDVVVFDDPLPGPEELRAMVTELCAGSKLESGEQMPQPSSETVEKAVEAVSGLSGFAAEQVVALSLGERGIDLGTVWERKRLAIEQTPGLSVYRGTETLDDLRGLESAKRRLRQHMRAQQRIGVVVWIDEGADVFAAVETDGNGVKQDQQRQLLVEMELNNWRGMIFTGVPGSGKSALCRGFGNEAGVPTIQMDLSGMESKWVGDSQQNVRHAMRVIKAVGRGNAFFLLTCNSLAGIRPQFQRRFKRGVFFFDLPTSEEREAIWRLYLDRYGLVGQERPDDDGWTGAEIKECAESAWDCGVTLKEAAQYIMPVARSRATEIDAMRTAAHGRFLSASVPGPYRYEAAPMKQHVRAVSLGPGPKVLMPKDPRHGLADMPES